VEKSGSSDDLARLLERLDDELVSVLDVDTLVVGDLVGVKTLLVDGARGHLLLPDETVDDGDAVVIVSERGGLVNDTGTGRVGNVGVGDDAESAVGVL
jgi:hypothetical protein